MDFGVLVMRDANLWGDLGACLAKLFRSERARVSMDSVSVSPMQATLCMVSEMTATIYMTIAVLTDIGLTAADVGNSAVTCGMSQQQRVTTLAVFAIVACVQICALAVAERINRRRARASARSYVLDVLNMWEKHRVYIALMMVSAAAYVIRAGITSRARMESCEHPVLADKRIKGAED